jgi:CO/xanthine dehydrogenase Mo-binding subunit
VYYGQPVGAVVAKSPEQAAYAAEKVKIEYNEMKPIISIEVSIY